MRYCGGGQDIVPRCSEGGKLHTSIRVKLEHCHFSGTFPRKLSSQHHSCIVSLRAVPIKSSFVCSWTEGSQKNPASTIVEAWYGEGMCSEWGLKALPLVAAAGLKAKREGFLSAFAAGAAGMYCRAGESNMIL